MRAYFWGTRGSLPASTTSRTIETKIIKAIKAARSFDLDTDESIRAFIHAELPFSVRGGYGNNTSCVEIKGSDEYVLCDAGTGLRDFGHHLLKSGNLQGSGSCNVFHIFISHLHWDHIQGFPFFLPAYMPGNHIHVYGHHDDLERVFVQQQDPPCFPVPLKAMKADIVFHSIDLNRSHEIAGLHVKCLKQNHPGDSYGYCFEKNRKKLVYSTDSEHKWEIENEEYGFLDFFRNADLLIFDAQYTLAEAIDVKENWGHSSNVVGVELAVTAGVKRFCMFHSEHTYDDETLDQFLRDTKTYLDIHAGSHPMEIYLAYDGLEIEI